MHKAMMLVASLCIVSNAMGQPEQTPQPDSQPFKFVRIIEPNIPTENEAVTVPPHGVQVFTCDISPCGAVLQANTIAVDYGQSGVLFDRKTGEFIRQFTVADGYPTILPRPFIAPPSRRASLVGPGILNYPNERSETPGVAVSVDFGGNPWTAMQPKNVLRDTFKTWTKTLNVANAESYLVCHYGFVNNGEMGRYTMKDGLASNLVTHLTVADGKLWAACADIYDPNRKDWGPGGLSCFDPNTEKWAHVSKIEGRPVRWVTLLQTVGEDLWVGFREGSGVVGDEIKYGRGIHYGQYRPVTTAIVLARLSKGKWTVFSRPPLDATEPVCPGTTQPASLPATGKVKEYAPTETPRNLAVIGNRLLLFSEAAWWRSGNWHAVVGGRLSMLDLASGQWRVFDTEKELLSRDLNQMIVDGNDVFILTNQYAYRWSEKDAKWALLDPQSPLVNNPCPDAVALVGKELWVGHSTQEYHVLGRQGISRFNEEKQTWSYVDPNEIGTFCPVRSIVPAGQEVLVLFGEPEWGGNSMVPDFSDQPRGAPGMGRYVAGKWEFPTRLDGVPEGTIKRTFKTNTSSEERELGLEVLGLFSAGGKAFVFNYGGLYEGPGKWRQVMAFNTYPFSPPHPSADGKTVEVAQDAKCLIYDPATGKTTVAAQSADKAEGAEQAARPPAEGMVFDGWIKLPTNLEGTLTLGGLPRDYYKVVKTPWAEWIVSHHQMIRLDRKQLSYWLGDSTK